MPILDATRDDNRGVTPAQVARLYAIAREHFVSSEEVKELLAQVGVEDARDLTRAQYDEFCGALETMDPPTEGRAVDPHTGEVYEDDALGEWIEPACSDCGDTGTETLIIDLPAPYCSHTQDRPCDCPGSVNERLAHAERQEERAA